MTVQEYIRSINQRYKTGISREQYFGNAPLKARE